MFERIEKQLSLSSINYTLSGHVLMIHLGRLSAKVKITYDYATNTYTYSCNELALYFSGFVMFVLSFHTMYQSEGAWWSGYVAGMMFASGLISFFTILCTYVKLIDLKSQLRDVGVFLKPVS